LEKDARAAGCTVVDGLQWLLFQGALAFELFTGRAAPISAMERALRSHRRSPMPTRPGSNGRRHLALIGFMGSGKSCVGRIIAERRGSRFIDIDERVAARSGQSVASIFQTRGEAEFRRLESEEIARAAAEPGAVISCGGGALLDRRNAASLWETSCLVWLWAGLNTTLDRLQNDSSRPLLPGGDRQGRARALLEERIPLYASSADFAVVTESLSPDGVAELILDETDRAEQN
jgi:shikimate kinase